MMKMTLHMAGHTACISYRYAYLRTLCADYLCPDGSDMADSADVEIAVTDEELAAEAAIYATEYPSAPAPGAPYIEALAIHRALAKALVPHGLFLMHSAVVAVDGEAYAFLAPSGVGKSTHLAQWKACFGPRATVINGDKPFYGFEGDTLLVHGTPWRGREGWGIPGSAPIKALCILERGQENRISRLTPAEALTGLMRQLYLPDDPALVSLCLKAMDRILRTVPVYCLQCTPTPEAAMLAYSEMTTARGEKTMKLKSGFILHAVGGEYIVVPVGARTKDFHGMIRLNGTGAFLWEHMTDGFTADTLVAALLEQYEVSEEQAAAAVESFLSTVRGAKLLEIDK